LFISDGLSFYSYDVSAIIARNIAKQPYPGSDRGQSLLFHEFMHLWVGYELVKVLRVFGLQPTCIREEVKSWSTDLYDFFMYFSDKKGNQDMEENALRILNVILTRTEHDGHFTSIRFGGKSHIEKLRNNILFLVVLTWLRQLQQYFYKLPERSLNRNWSEYGNYCETVLPMKTTPLANI
jgi:hypothetical protein